MADPTPAAELWLVRHGQTEWSRLRRHTSTTDLELTEVGRDQASGLWSLLDGAAFDRVWSSPRRRALQTAEIAGLEPEIIDDLVEWDYGELEGLTTQQIRQNTPDWTVWTHDVPGGESVEAVGERMDRVIAGARDLGGRTLIFGHGHALRVLAARWVGLPADCGRSAMFDTAAVSVLGDDRGVPVVRQWNVTVDIIRS